MTFPQSQRVPRPPRVRPAEFTPIVLRKSDGDCSTGTLLLYSLTGGLMSLPKLLDKGCKVRLMFLLQAGPVQGTAEMLRPVSWTEQPFRFVALHEGDQQRLRSATRLPRKSVSPVFGAKTLRLANSPASENTPPLDPEQGWIEKYRAATAPPDRSRTMLSRIFSPKVIFATAIAATLGGGLLYALQLHLLR